LQLSLFRGRRREKQSKGHVRRHGRGSQATQSQSPSRKLRIVPAIRQEKNRTASQGVWYFHSRVQRGSRKGSTTAQSKGDVSKIVPALRRNSQRRRRGIPVAHMRMSRDGKTPKNPSP